jgi:hypothetical protein
MTEGNPSIRSMGSLTFGPEGILFIADAKSAADRRHLDRRRGRPHPPPKC